MLQRPQLLAPVHIPHARGSVLGPGHQRRAVRRHRECRHRRGVPHQNAVGAGFVVERAAALQREREDPTVAAARVEEVLGGIRGDGVEGGREDDGTEEEAESDAPDLRVGGKERQQKVDAERAEGGRKPQLFIRGSWRVGNCILQKG